MGSIGTWSLVQTGRSVPESTRWNRGTWQVIPTSAPSRLGMTERTGAQNVVRVGEPLRCVPSPDGRHSGYPRSPDRRLPLCLDLGMERDAGGRNFRIMSRARFLEVWRGAGAEFRIGMWLVMLGTLGAVSAAVLLAMGSGWSGLLVGVLALVVAEIGNFLRVQAFKRYLSR